MNTSNRLTPPSSSLTLLESRAALDWMSLPLRLAALRLYPCANIGEGRSVYLLPGFGASERSMYPLQFFLEKHGFNVYDWGLGVNKAGLDRSHDPENVSWEFPDSVPKNGETGVSHLCDLMVQKIQNQYEKSDESIALVGWSLGGTIAREVARDLPHIISHVVTLGSPLLGGPKYTAAAPILKKRGLDLDWIEREVNRRNRIPLQCKASAIVSPSDGVVDISASVIPNDQDTEYLKVNLPHLGMGINNRVFNLVLDALR